MTRRPADEVSLEVIEQWLTGTYQQPVENFAPLPGGFWTNAYGYRLGDQDLVLRLNHLSESFGIDVLAAEFSHLPVPKIFARGFALGHHFAISQRLFGRFLEDVEAAQAQSALGELLPALRATDLGRARSVNWYLPEGVGPSWQQWIREGAVIGPDLIDASVASLAKTLNKTINQLTPACPERRDLVHGDLLHGNVLVDEQGGLSGLFSWKCSARGDFLYDIAWCTFWAPWHAALQTLDLWPLLIGAADLDSHALENASERHHCYQLQIGLTHLRWYTWVDDAVNLQKAAHRLEEILERGPLSLPR